MDAQRSIDSASYAFSVSLLRMLLEKDMITEEEFDKISAICAEHYGTDFYCV